MDVELINGLIDQKYEVKKKKSKALVSACATLRTVLTDDQKKKMKEIWKKEKCDKKECSLKDKKKGKSKKNSRVDRKKRDR